MARLVETLLYVGVDIWNSNFIYSS